MDIPPPAIFTKYDHLLAGTGLELVEPGTRGLLAGCAPRS